MKESPLILFLYRTVPGRVLLKILVHPSVSKAAARFFSSGLSAPVIPYFARKNRIDRERFAIPPGGYSSFNDFFTRKLKEEYLPSLPSSADRDSVLISPCDGLLTVKRIREDSVFEIKHCRYVLSELLKSKKLAKSFSGGYALIFRLTPKHYHRYLYAGSGTLRAKRTIPGILHCVRPAALSEFPVFVENSRKYTVIRNPRFGRIVQMEIGALLVGKITDLKKSYPGQEVYAGMEKGYFEYGGSTIILLLEKKPPVRNAFRSREKISGEVPVSIGKLLL
ncbi:MAG: phosphatidylserine decarboxylase [Lachnospiraceae bacterium]|nr:phosphatidylserine decarboxylase [Lachnospiraceae bacterium]